MKLKALIFDSSVLININKALLKDATKKIISYYLPADKFMKTYERKFKQLQTGKLTEEEFFKELLKELPTRSQKRVREQHDSQREQIIKLNKGVKSVLNTLSQYYKLGLISNMPKCWFDKDAKRLGLNTGLFNTQVFSCKKGVLKPELAIYQQAIKDLKEQSSRCAYITNHEYEINGAIEAGMTVITIGLGGDYEINKLTELIDLFNNQDEISKNKHEVNSP